jgi:hypothetical protein
MTFLLEVSQVDEYRGVVIMIKAIKMFNKPELWNRTIFHSLFNNYGTAPATRENFFYGKKFF